MKNKSSESTNKPIELTIFMFLAVFAMTVVAMRGHFFALDADLLADDNVPVAAAVVSAEEEIVPEAPSVNENGILTPDSASVDPATAFADDVPDDVWAENGEAKYWIANLLEWHLFNFDTQTQTSVAVWEASDLMWAEIVDRGTFNKVDGIGQGVYVLSGTSEQVDMTCVYDLAQEFGEHTGQNVLLVCNGEGAIHVAIFLMEEGE